MSKDRPPLIGITTDVVEGEPIGGSEVRLRAVGAMTYVNAVEGAGGLAILLPAVPGHAREQVQVCDAIVMTGGDDPKTEGWGVPTHPRARPMHPLRQQHELALLAALDEIRARPVLGVCLGMQLMSLHNGGTLDQCLAESLTTHAEHVKDNAHRVVPAGDGGLVVRSPGRVASNHRQGVTGAGRLRVAARAEDGVIEAVEDPQRDFYVGVQWHPERTADEGLGRRVFCLLVEAAKRAKN